MRKPKIQGCCCFIMLIAQVLVADEQFCGDLNDDTLQLSIVLYRHGDRTPVKSYPNDPYQETAWLPWGGWGFLTQEGMRRHYHFGQWMRHCYDTFLNDTYSPADVYIRATVYARCLDSSSTNLVGLYPPKGVKVWSTNITLADYWQPIPIHSAAGESDYLLIADIPCPPYDELISEFWANDPEINKIRNENQALLDYIAENAGLPLPGDLYTISDLLSDSVLIEMANGLVLPKWLNETVQVKLREWDNLFINVRTANDEMIRYAGGELVALMQEIMINKTTGLMSQQLIILSSHDTTVAALLGVYGEFNEVRPPYASAVFTELHLNKTNNRYFVKAFYRNDTASDPYPIAIRNCGDPCWVDQYMKEIDPLKLQYKNETCLGSPSINTGIEKSAIIAISVITSFGTMLIVALVLFAKFKPCKWMNTMTAFSYERLDD